MSTIHELLGGAPLLQPRPESQLEFTAALSKKERSNLPADKLIKVKESACGGITNKFTGIEPQLTSSKKLEQVYDIGLRLFELRKSIIDHDMEDVFNILSSQDLSALTNAQVPHIGNVAPTNLFDCFGKITVDEVKESNKYYSQYGLQYTVQNLIWSEARVLNSLEIKLQAKVLDRLRATPAAFRGGPLALKLALDIILDLTHENLHSMSEAIRNLNLSDFPGENISKAVSYLRGTITILKNCNALMDSNSLFYHLYIFFKTASCTEFVAYVNQIYLNHVEKLNVLTVDQMLDKLESHYTSLYNLKKWSAATNDTESVFYTPRGNTPDLSNIICHRCGAKGHYANRCNAPAPTGPKGGKPLPVATVDRKPPAKDQPHERIVNNIQEYWCGHCQQWTNHSKNTPACPSSKNRVHLVANTGSPGATVPSVSSPTASTISFQLPVTPSTGAPTVATATTTTTPSVPAPVPTTAITTSQPGVGVIMDGSSLVTRDHRTGD